MVAAASVSYQTPDRTGLTKRKSELVSGLTSIENISLKILKIFHVGVRSHLQPRHEDILGLGQDGGNSRLRQQGGLTEPDNISLNPTLSSPSGHLTVRKSA